jgi:hypothetical protein
MQVYDYRDTELYSEFVRDCAKAVDMTMGNGFAAKNPAVLAAMMNAWIQSSCANHTGERLNRIAEAMDEQLKFIALELRDTSGALGGIGESISNLRLVLGG